MFVHDTEIRVRYGETDQMGFVYYGNYALYYEVGRVEAIRALGLTYRQLEEAGTFMPVVRVESKFIYPAKYDDLLTIRSVVNELPDRMIHFDVSILNENKVILHKGKVTLCFKNEEGKLVRAPLVLLQKLNSYFD